MKVVYALVFVALFLASALLPAVNGSPGPAASPLTTSVAPLSATLKGPELIANSSTHMYVVTLSGGSGQGNYSYNAFVNAKNMTSLSISPSTGTNALGVFYLNFTSGPAAEVVTLTLNTTSGSGSSQATASRQFLITVVDPVVIRVPVTNEGSAGVQNANVSLYINNKYIASNNVSLSAGQTSNVTFYWVAYSYPTGNNMATVKISSSGQLFFSNGEIQTSFSIYMPGSTQTAIDNYLIVACVGAAMVLFLIYFRKPKPRF